MARAAKGGLKPLLGLAVSLRSAIHRAAEWIGYYQLLPDIIGYFPCGFKTHELTSVKMYGNNDMFYGGTIM